MPIRDPRNEIKSEAKSLLHTAHVSPLRFTMLYLAVNALLSLLETAASYFLADSFGEATPSLTFLSLLIALFGVVLTAGYTNYCLCVRRGEDTPYASLFDGFSFAGKAVVLMLLEVLLCSFASVLFIVPGILLFYAYSFALFDLCDDPSLGVVEALRLSRQQTKGYRLSYFSLQVSFFPFLLLDVLALALCDFIVEPLLPLTAAGDLLYTLFSHLFSGAVLFYAMPYFNLSLVGFYRRVTASEESSGED